MRRLNVLAGACVVALASAGCGQSAGTLDAAAEALGATTLNSIEFSGTGTWFQLGQPADPALPWTAFPLSSYKFLIDYETTSARGEIVRKDETAAPPASLRPIQLISSGYVWNMGRPRGVQGNLPPGTAPGGDAPGRTRAACPGQGPAHGRPGPDDGDRRDAAWLPQSGAGE